MQELFMSLFGWEEWEYLMNLMFFVSGLLNGITMAGTLFVIASGFTLVFGLMRIINMAHGAMLLLGGYLGITAHKYLFNYLNLESNTFIAWILAVIFAMAGIAVAIVILQFALLRWVQGNEARETLLTLGVATIMADVMKQDWSYGPHLQTLARPTTFDGKVNVEVAEFYDFDIAMVKFYVLGIAILVGIGIWLMMTRTQLGRMIRAGVDNRNMVSALGIDIGKLFLFVFIVAGALTGLGGVIGLMDGSNFKLVPGTDMSMLTFSLIVVIIGGMGSLPGAALGALLVGLVYNITFAFSTTSAEVVLFAVLIVILVLRPYGLLGKRPAS